MPWVVPSENLFFCGEIISDYIGEEIRADWSRRATMGSTQPNKLDYTTGILRKAFTDLLLCSLAFVFCFSYAKLKLEQDLRPTKHTQC
jgi:hypothetical protein